MAEEFRTPQSANEALLQNILGAENEIREPQSWTEYYLKKIWEEGTGGGGNDDILLVKIDTTANPRTSDKTFAEIKEAYDAGKPVIGIVHTNRPHNKNMFSFAMVTESKAIFAAQIVSEMSEQMILTAIDSWAVNSNNNVEQIMKYPIKYQIVMVYEKDGGYESGANIDVFALRSGTFGVLITINNKTFRSTDITVDGNYQGYTATIVDVESKKIYYARQTVSGGRNVELTEVDMIPSQN